MNVSKAERAAEPGYPDAREFRRSRHLLGVVVIGAGMAMNACAQRLPGEPPPPPPPPPPPSRVAGGISAVRQATVPADTERSKPPVSPPVRTMGKIKVEPKQDRPQRLLGVPTPQPRKPGAPPPAR